jgi:hypothetical protein
VLVEADGDGHISAPKQLKACAYPEVLVADLYPVDFIHIAPLLDKE